MKRVLITSILFLLSTFSYGMTVTEFSQVMKTQLNYPEDMKLYFTGLMSSALMFNALSLDIHGKRFFCSPIEMKHNVDEHIQITNYYIETVGDNMRAEYRSFGRNFDEAEISEVYAYAIMTVYGCDYNF